METLLDLLQYVYARIHGTRLGFLVFLDSSTCPQSLHLPSHDPVVPLKILAQYLLIVPGLNQFLHSQNCAEIRESFAHTADIWHYNVNLTQC